MTGSLPNLICHLHCRNMYLYWAAAAANSKWYRLHSRGLPGFSGTSKLEPRVRGRWRGGGVMGQKGRVEEGIAAAGRYAGAGSG